MNQHETFLLSHSNIFFPFEQEIEEDPFPATSKESICREELREYILSSEWTRDIVTLLRNTIQRRLHLRICKREDCARFCDAAVFIRDSSLVQMVNELSAVERVDNSFQRVPNDCNEDKRDSSKMLQQQIRASDLRCRLVLRLNPPGSLSSTGSIPTMSCSSKAARGVGVLVTETMLKDEKPVILGTTNYTFPPDAFDEEKWCATKQMLNQLLNGDKKDEFLISAALAKEFFNWYFSEEEVLNCSQRSQKMHRSKKTTRAFDPIKKELVFSATSFLMKNPTATAAEFYSALKQQSESLKLTDNLRKHLHTRIFSKYALDARSTIEKRKRQQRFSLEQLIFSDWR